MMKRNSRLHWWHLLAVAPFLVLAQGCGSGDTQGGQAAVEEAAAEAPPVAGNPDAEAPDGAEAVAYEIPSMPAAELVAALELADGPIVLDVRTAEEFEAAHVPGAINIPHDEVGARLAELEQYRNREIVVYCRSGKRAGEAGQVLSAAGFEGVKDLEGHMVFWKAHELPLAGTCC